MAGAHTSYVNRNGVGQSTVQSSDASFMRDPDSQLRVNEMRDEEQTEQLGKKSKSSISWWAVGAAVVVLYLLSQ